MDTDSLEVMQYLFTVEDVFLIEGRGCVLVPGIPSAPDFPTVLRGEAIRLKTPDGRAVETVIEALEMVSYRTKPEKICIPILLPKDITKGAVPLGTEVYLLRER